MPGRGSGSEAAACASAAPGASPSAAAIAAAPIQAEKRLLGKGRGIKAMMKAVGFSMAPPAYFAMTANSVDANLTNMGRTRRFHNARFGGYTIV
jgi:hypothetical protein